MARKPWKSLDTNKRLSAPQYPSKTPDSFFASYSDVPRPSSLRIQIAFYQPIKTTENKVDIKPSRGVQWSFLVPFGRGTRLHELHALRANW